MKDIAHDAFKAQVREIASQVGVSVKEVHIRHMTTKWASCSSKGRLTFDPELFGKSEEERLRVVLHELLHLRYPNHGKMFRRMLDLYAAKIPSEERR